MAARPGGSMAVEQVLAHPGARAGSGMRTRHPSRPQDPKGSLETDFIAESELSAPFLPISLLKAHDRHDPCCLGLELAKARHPASEELAGGGEGVGIRKFRALQPASR